MVKKGHLWLLNCKISTCWFCIAIRTFHYAKLYEVMFNHLTHILWKWTMSDCLWNIFIAGYPGTQTRWNSHLLLGPTFPFSFLLFHLYIATCKCSFRLLSCHPVEVLKKHGYTQIHTNHSSLQSQSVSPQQYDWPFLLRDQDYLYCCMNLCLLLGNTRSWHCSIKSWSASPMWRVWFLLFSFTKQLK